LPVPSLEGVAGRRAGAALATFLGGHHAGGGAAAADLAAWLMGRAAAPPLQPAQVGGDAVARGGRLFTELGCRACHGEPGIDGYAERTDFAHALAFLRQPAAARADLTAHDFGLDGAEATGLAAWLLRQQCRDPGGSAPQPGLVVECFELHVGDAGLPALD